MTDPHARLSELVEVIQADREAAGGMIVSSFHKREVVTGRMDQHGYVQAFARHRLAQSTADKERIARLEGALRPFALDLRDEVPDDTLIETVAWTAGEHRAARAALSEDTRNG